VILDGQRIHASVALKSTSYRTRATGVNWEALRGNPVNFNTNEAEVNTWLEYVSLLNNELWDKDIYDFSTTVPFWLDQIGRGVEGSFRILETIFPDGKVPKMRLYRGS
jgi:hypothetical protein